MTIIIALLGLAIAALSVWGFVVPQKMIDTMLSFWNKPSGMYLAIGFRLVFGVLFILTAPETRFPLVFEILGYIMLVAAVAILIVGKKRLTRFIEWWAKLPPPWVHVWLVFAFAAGLFIFYGAM
jgi:hypothetical protein